MKKSEEKEKKLGSENDVIEGNEEDYRGGQLLGDEEGRRENEVRKRENTRVQNEGYRKKVADGGANDTSATTAYSWK